MLTRRHIRVKAMQSIYAMLQSKNTDIDKEDKFLSFSIANMYNLYLILISLLIEIREKAEERLTLSKKKYVATREEINPNTSYVINKVLLMRRDNHVIREELKRKRFNHYDIDSEYVTLRPNEIYRSELYETYMSTPVPSFSEDKGIPRDIYR